MSNIKLIKNVVNYKYIYNILLVQNNIIIITIIIKMIDDKTGFDCEYVLILLIVPCNDPFTPRIPSLYPQ